MTNDLYRRVQEHRKKLVKGFTSRYGITMLVYYEEHWEPSQAIAREKQINGWTREKKIALIESINPRWNDLASGWENNRTPFGASRGMIEIRSTKYLTAEIAPQGQADETLNKSEMRISKCEMTYRASIVSDFGLGVLDFLRISILEFRICEQ